MARYETKLYNRLPDDCPDKIRINTGGPRKGRYECLAQWKLRKRNELECEGFEGEAACVNCLLRYPTYTIGGQRISADEVKYNPTGGKEG